MYLGCFTGNLLSFLESVPMDSGCPAPQRNAAGIREVALMLAGLRTINIKVHRTTAHEIEPSFEKWDLRYAAS
jgi:hypothetical protein